MQLRDPNKFHKNTECIVPKKRGRDKTLEFCRVGRWLGGCERFEKER